MEAKFFRSGRRMDTEERQLTYTPSRGRSRRLPSKRALRPPDDGIGVVRPEAVDTFGSRQPVV